MLEALLSKWKDFLLRTFDIRMGEFKRVVLMLLNVFLLIQCLWIIKPVVNAQFLSRVGIEKLPLVFLLVALTALAFSTVYSRWINREPLGTIMLRTYLISIIGLLTFGVLLTLHLFPDWMSYVFYIGVALFGLITTSQFWLLANLLFSSLEAKRLFGFIGAGAIAGGISGGYLTSLLSQFMDSRYLLFVAAGLLIISMILNQRIWISILPLYNKTRQDKKGKTLHEYPLRLIRNSKHLTYLALIIGISVLVAKLVEFQFSAIASENIKDPDDLTAYFGFWFSTANAVALAIQLLLTQKAVGFLGVGRSLFVLPGALFMSAAAVLNTPVLWAGTALKVIDISLKQSINKAATELLILPVPMAVKSQAKTYIDVFVDTTATGVGGLMLIFLINGLDFSVRAVSIMILMLIALWIIFAVRARNEYVLAFQRQLGLTTAPLENNVPPPSVTSVADGIRRTLRSGSTEQILHLLESLEESKDPGLMRDVIPLLAHPLPRIRHAALSALYYHTDHSITKEIEPLLRDPHDEVRSRAFSALLTHTRQNRVQFINDYLTDKDPAIRRAALVGLATETRDNPKMQQQFELEQRLMERLNIANTNEDPEEIEDTKIMVAKAIGYGKIESLYPLLTELMHDINPAIARKAILAAGNSGDLGFVKTLISLLMNDNTRSAVQKSLAKYKPSDILPLLAELTSDNNTPLELLLRLPALAETMDTQQAIDFLFGLLIQHHYPALKLEALEVLHKIRAKFPHLSISGKRIMPYLMEEADLYKDTLALCYSAQQGSSIHDQDIAVSEARKELTDLLEDKLDDDLKRIFWILGLSYPPGLILPLYHDLRHQDQDMRISTVELLDNLLDPNLKKAVISIVESAMLDKLSHDDLGRLEVNIHSENACYESILNGNDEELKNAVLKLIKAMKDSEFEYLLG
ncbi:MAG TPA: Npt1/Npt2 family nucleotide transporter [Saprospiraceae bacterium]|nr:Npt1/Npt2 family nucleotide transporter [Saprospiraceae bacterium]